MYLVYQAATNKNDLILEEIIDVLSSSSLQPSDYYVSGEFVFN